MLEFVNDPKFEGVPLVGDGHVLLAERRACGRSARWVPGGNVVALAEFLGPEFPVLDGGLYEKQPSGSLLPVDLSAPMLVMVPMAGEPRFVRLMDGFSSRFSQVVEVDGAVAPLPDPAVFEAAVQVEVARRLDELDSAAHARGPLPGRAEIDAAAEAAAVEHSALLSAVAGESALEAEMAAADAAVAALVSADPAPVVVTDGLSLAETKDAHTKAVPVKKAAKKVAGAAEKAPAKAKG